ncbi:PREDICTED: F-box protein At3g47030-like [Camelina sativa]|uniref:F-box protein At3g47030-like n=1 Tax=Camelina sativa TaxID=90675 RepID=A0ABM0UT10_CAMSA|nr:PREDICTED: F-box protein At3g47030-like [Camelina sativa]
MFGILGLINAAMGKRQKRLVPSPSKSLGEYSKEIPVDLLIDVFSRLPLKDVASCRCVSKLWSSILRCPEFTQLFLKISTVRPRILFTFLYNDKRIFYSMPQDLNPNRNYSSPISPYYQMQFPKGLGSCEDMCPSILGLICNKSKKPMICNPSTGEYISLPLAKTKRNQMRPYFGYDPIDKIFKVLCVSDDYVYRVSTLGTGVGTWKKVECSIPHQPLHTEICIDGVLYYLAERLGNGTPSRYMLVCFDVKLERFKFLVVDLLILSSALINYQGKLGILLPNQGSINKRTESFELRVLENSDEVKWSKTVYVLPSYWNDLVAYNNLRFVGMTSAGVIVLSTYQLLKPFYLFYYNTVKNTVVRVEIEFGSEFYCNCPNVVTFINHVENVELMD